MTPFPKKKKKSIRLFIIRNKEDVLSFGIYFFIRTKGEGNGFRK